MFSATRVVAVAVFLGAVALATGQTLRFPKATTYVNSPATGVPYYIGVGDMEPQADVNGFLDVIVSGPDSVMFLRNVGGRSFPLGYLVSSRDFMTGVPTDFDNDNDTDVWLAPRAGAASNTIFLAENDNGLGSISEHNITVSPGGPVRDLIVLDANGDGNMDAVYTNALGMVLLQKDGPTGTAHTSSIVAAGVDIAGVTAGDFGGGYKIAACRTDGLYLYQPGGVSTKVSSSVCNMTIAVDLNNDNKLDLVTYNKETSQMRAHLSTGTYTTDAWDPSHSVGSVSNVVSMDSLDANNDLFQDVVVATTMLPFAPPSTGVMRVYLNDMTGQAYTAQTQGDLVNGPAVAADLDRDGLKDLVNAAYVSTGATTDGTAMRYQRIPVVSVCDGTTTNIDVIPQTNNSFTYSHGANNPVSATSESCVFIFTSPTTADTFTVSANLSPEPTPTNDGAYGVLQIYDQSNAVGTASQTITESTPQGSQLISTQNYISVKWTAPPLGEGASFNLEIRIRADSSTTNAATPSSPAKSNAGVVAGLAVVVVLLCCCACVAFFVGMWKASDSDDGCVGYWKDTCIPSKPDGTTDLDVL